MEASLGDGEVVSSNLAVLAHACVLECCALPQRVVCALVAGQQDALPATCVNGNAKGGLVLP